MLNTLIEQYIDTLDDSLPSNEDLEEYSDQLLEKIACELEKDNWENEILLVENNFKAMETFWFLFIREIRLDGFPAAYLCYYFSCLVAYDTNLPLEKRLEGNKYRAFIMFKMDSLTWYSFLTQARLEYIKSNGILTEKEFFDFLILSDVYKAWDIDPNHYIMDDLKKQAPTIASIYPSFNKEKIIYEAELAHKAIFSLIKQRITRG